MIDRGLPTWNAAHDVAHSVLSAAVTFGLVDLSGFSDWMRSTLKIRFADVVFEHGKPEPGVLYTITLGDETPEPGSREDRTCDHCGHFVPFSAPDGEFYTVQIALLANVFVWGGLCALCIALENVQEVTNRA